MNRWVFAVPLGLITAILLLWQWPDAQTVEPTEKQQIKLMTSLPIVWGEGASMENILSGQSKSAPIYDHWRRRYDIDAVDSLEGLEASTTDIIILAQPPAMDPADLAVFDDWMRKGGKALILTDPALVWHSDFPIGDRRRPLVTGLLSPLLVRWGLELLAPDGEREGVVRLNLNGLEIVSAGVGSFGAVESTGDGKASCEFGDGNLVALCRVGKGRAALVADADLLDPNNWPDFSDRPVGEVSDVMRFTDMIIDELNDIASVSNN